MPASRSFDINGSRDKRHRGYAQQSRSKDRTTVADTQDLGMNLSLGNGLSGDLSRGGFQEHSALLNDTRLSQSANVSIRTQTVRQLQRAFGNRYVQRLALNSSRAKANAVQTRPSDSPLEVGHDTEADSASKQGSGLWSSEALESIQRPGQALLPLNLTHLAGQGALSVQKADDITSTNISETTDTGNKYTQELVLNKTKARITVYLGVKWVKKGTWASDDAYNAFIRKVKTSAYSYLDNKFKVVCTPKAPGAGTAPIDLPIDFIIYDWDSGYEIDAHGGPPGGRSAMTQAGGNVYEYKSATDLEEPITFAHEFGHAILGASDEYANPAVPGRVLTNDHSIMANYYTQGKTQAEFKARHFQHIVTEVAKAFAGYTCSLKEM